MPLSGLRNITYRDRPGVYDSFYNRSDSRDNAFNKPSLSYFMIDIQKMLIADEGYKLTVYRCSAGFLTGGIGHNFEADPAFPIMQRPVRFGDKISPDEVLALFDYDIRKVMSGLNKRIIKFNEMPENYRAVLINMAFQMGVAGLLRFKKLLAAMSFKDDKVAEQEIIHSKYYSDTPKRAKRIIALIRGDVPREYL